MQLRPSLHPQVMGGAEHSEIVIATPLDRDQRGDAADLLIARELAHAGLDRLLGTGQDAAGALEFGRLMAVAAQSAI